MWKYSCNLSWARRTFSSQVRDSERIHDNGSDDDDDDDSSLEIRGEGLTARNTRNSSTHHHRQAKDETRERSWREMIDRRIGGDICHHWTYLKIWLVLVLIMKTEWRILGSNPISTNSFCEEDVAKLVRIVCHISVW
jgi:hypothetical protein